MKTKVFTSLFALILLTGCTVSEGGTPATNSTAEASQGASTPIDKASEVALMTSMVRANTLIEGEGAATGKYPDIIPETTKNVGEVGSYRPAEDKLSYCLHFKNTETNVSKTFFSEEGEYRNGGTCDNFS